MESWDGYSNIISNTDRAWKFLDLLFSMVQQNSFMVGKFSPWVILDVNSLHRFGLLPTWLFLLQVNLHINMIIIITTSYEGTLVSFWCENTFRGNGAQILWYPRNIICLIVERNHTSTFNRDIILKNTKYRNIKAFLNIFDLYWKYIFFKLHKISLVAIVFVSCSSVKYD